MRRGRASRAIVTWLGVLLAGSTATAATLTGELSAADAKRPDGSWFDTYLVDLDEGEQLTVLLVSDVFDAYLIVSDPDGLPIFNDDRNEGELNAEVQLTAALAGTYTIVASALSRGQPGPYTLTLDGGANARLQEPPPVPEPIHYDNTLEAGGRRRPDGQYYHGYQFEATLGQSVSIDLRSDDFDPFLIVTGPDGVPQMDDDSGGGLAAHVGFQVPQTGTYKIIASTTSADETGDYTLDIRFGPAGGPGDTITGQLQPGDLTRPDGSYVDLYTVDATPGATLTVTLRSTEFDSWLLVLDPLGLPVWDDDSGGDLDAMISLPVEQGGPYRIVVTSMAGGQGAYSLTVSGGTVTDAGGAMGVDLPGVEVERAAPPPVTVPGQPPVAAPE